MRQPACFAHAAIAYPIWVMRVECSDVNHSPRKAEADRCPIKLESDPSSSAGEDVPQKLPINLWLED